MSGSSLDGLDIALCEVTGEEDGGFNYSLIRAITVEYGQELVSRLSRVAENSFEEIAILDKDLCLAWGEAILDFLKNSKEKVDFISSHGHTIIHIPEKGVSKQIGNGGYLSALTKLPVISDFRIQDVALLGQGTPLVPIAEMHLFSGYDFYLNLGGIANLTYQDPSFRALDICPCNQALNHLANNLGLAFDQDGQYSRKGKVNKQLLNDLNSCEYFHQIEPKSLDNQWIKKNFLTKFDLKDNIEDQLRTTCECIVMQIVSFLNSQGAKHGKVLVTGGGAKNKFLMELLANALDGLNIEVVVPDEQLIDYKEAILMSFLGYLRFLGVPNVLSSVTGAKSNNIGGAIYDVYGKLVNGQI